MTTFIIIGNFIINARLLDNKRLGKQRVEAYQILNTILNGGKWSKHPIVIAWTNFTGALNIILIV